MCLVDLDLLAPGLHYLFGMQPKRPCLQDALIADPFKPDVSVKSSDLCHVVENSPPANALLLLGASPALKDAARIQSYVLADARAGLLGARLERLLKDVKQEHGIDIFVLDTPPSLFGISRTASNLVARHRGAQVHVAMPILQDLMGCRAMLEVQQAEQDGRDADAPAPIVTAFVLNNYDGPGEEKRLHEEFAERILRAGGKVQNEAGRGPLEEWLRQRKLAFLHHNVAITRMAAADRHAPITPKICDELPKCFREITLELANRLDEGAA